MPSTACSSSKSADMSVALADDSNSCGETITRPCLC
jgi:hypothetical protein